MKWKINEIWRDHTEKLLAGSDSGVKHLNKCHFLELAASFCGPLLTLMLPTVLL